MTSVTGFATGWSGTDLMLMPDGNVGYVSFGTGAPGTGAIKSIVYSPGNASPVAAAARHADLGQRAADRGVQLDRARATPTATR